MADKKISEFPSGVPSSQAVMLQYELASERGGANYKLSLQDVMNLIGPAIGTSPDTPYVFPRLAATVGTFNTVNVSGQITTLGPISANSSVGTLGQVLTSAGTGTSVKWIDNFPAGGIIMWSGTIANIPTGWALCDGTNSTPDLRNKFVIGAYSDDSSVAKTTITGTPTTTGGSKDSIVVSHTHGITEPNSGQGHRHPADTTNGGFALWPSPVATGSEQNQSGGPADYTKFGNPTSYSTTGITIDSSGVSGVSQNLPPYYALAFIMKLAYT